MLGLYESYCQISTPPTPAATAAATPAVVTAATAAVVSHPLCPWPGSGGPYARPHEG